MLRIIIEIIIAAILAITATLSLVTWTKMASLETQISSVQKNLKNVTEKLASSAESHDKAPDNSHSAPHWGYEGAMNPAKWGDTFATCGTGKAQSPIDIRGPFEKSTNALTVDYKPIPLKVLNNGHTLQVNVAPGSQMSIGGEKYDLLQFHFHRPSEELIEGKPAAMVAHFVHKSAGGKLAVVGVLLNQGTENEVIRSIWSNAPKQEGPEVDVPGVALNLMKILPAALEYYSFEGSLTTPPCTEGVTFYILKASGNVSREQVNAFPFTLNARPVQALNGRKVTAN